MSKVRIYHEVGQNSEKGLMGWAEVEKMLVRILKRLHNYD